MAYTSDHGVPDIDATHAWAPATGDAPPVLNDRITDPPTLPWIKVFKIPGWGDLAELLTFDEAKTYGEGETSYPARLLGKTVVYVCEVRATTREDVRELITGCLRGFGESATDADNGEMTITPYSEPGGVVWTMTGAVRQFTRDDTFSYFEKLRAPYRWGFTVSIRMRNPRFFTGGIGYLA